jgi:hypothetical protein
MTQQDMFTQKLSKAQEDMMSRITAALTGMGCKWVIITPDGTRHGNMEAVASSEYHPNGRKKRRPLKYRFGFKSGYVTPFIKDLQVGQTAVIPFHESMTPNEVQSSASSMANRLWGKQQSKVILNYKNKAVEVTRTGGL